MNYKPIGIFDSGIGGLTVLQNLVKKLPDEKYIYIGDNINCPYGDKTKEQLYTYACSIIDYLINREVKLIAVACNTVSSNILPLLIEKYSDVKIIGVIEATAKQLLKDTNNKTLVIATKATIESHAYKQQIAALNDKIVVDELMTPLLVPLIESGLYDEIEKTLHCYLDQVSNDYDSLVLGCTHYPIIEDMLKKIIGNKKIISSSDGIVNDVDEYLTKYDLKGKDREIEIYTTGDTQAFMSSSATFVNYESIKVKKLHLD